MISELDQLSQKGMTDGWDKDIHKKEKDLWGQLEARERHEGIYWKQKSKVKWLQDGEKKPSPFIIRSFRTGTPRGFRNLKIWMVVE